MAKSVTAGAMRTRVTVKKPTTVIDADGISALSWANVLSGTNMLRCKWVSAHGTDVVDNMRNELGQVATITCRFTSLINQQCRVWYENEAQTDANAWEIISVNDPEDAHKYLEITLKRSVIA